MKKLILKAPLPVMLLLAIAFSTFLVSAAHADESKTVTAVLNETNLTKQISVPLGYRPHIAKLQMVGSGTDEFTVTVLVGSEQTNLSWPGSHSRRLPLPPKDWKGVTTVPVSVSAPPVFTFLLNVEIICLKDVQPKGY